MLLEPLSCPHLTCRFPGIPLPTSSSPAYVQAALSVREVFRAALEACILRLGTDHIEGFCNEAEMVGHVLANMVPRRADAHASTRLGPAGELRVARLGLLALGIAIRQGFGIGSEGHGELMADVEAKVLSATWSTVARAYSKVRHLAGTRSYAASKLAAAQLISVTMHRTSLLPRNSASMNSFRPPATP